MELLRSEHKIGKAGSLEVAAIELRVEADHHAGAGNVEESSRLLTKAIKLDQRADKLRSRANDLIHKHRNG